MSVSSIRRLLFAGALVTAPLFGLIAALATPALRTTDSAALTAIAGRPDRFYVYAICILVSGVLLVPAVFALVELVRPQRPGWALAASLITQTGVVVAVGDAASELVYWQMGRQSGDHAEMTALAIRYNNALGASLVYTVGGLATLVGLALLGGLLWRARAVPRWAALALPVGAIVNIVGFSIASQTTLVASYLVLTAALTPAAVGIVGRSAEQRDWAPAPALT